MARPIPRQSAIWDSRRNTSAVKGPPPGAVTDAIRTLERWRWDNPNHADWIEAGHPTMTEDEHVRRFGVTYQESLKGKGRK